MSSDTSETVKRSRELMDSGIDPVALMSQLAGLIMDIIAGTYKLADSNCCNGSAVGGRSYAELERLQQALKILSDAEKQIRLSSERPTWFTAALLQLGSSHTLDINQPKSTTREHPTAANDAMSEAARQSSSSRTVSHSLSTFAIAKKALDDKTISVQSSPQVLASHSSRSRMNENLLHGGCWFVDRVPLNSSKLNDDCSQQRALVHGNSDSLAQIWISCIENCHSKTLQQLLLDHGKLVSIRQFEGHAIAFIAFEDCGIKSRAQRFLSSITNSIENVLKCNVEIKMGPLAELMDREQTLEAGPNVRRFGSDVLSFSSNSDRLKGTFNSSRRSFDHPDEGNKQLEKCKNTPCADERLHSVSITSLDSGIPKARGLEVPTQATKESINGGQCLESVWLQDSEKDTPGMMDQARNDRHLILSQDVDNRYQSKSSMPQVVPSIHVDEDLAHYTSQKHQSGLSENGCVISPSKLHRNDDMANCDNESICSESGRPGCHGLFPCWKTQKPKVVKVKRQMRVKSS